MRNHSKLAILALALAVALPSAAQDSKPATVLPADLPAYAADKPLPVPVVEKATLANGMQIWVVPRQGIPRVDYVLAIRDAGFAADPAGLPGFAGSLSYMLNEGTERYDSRTIAEMAQGMGGSVGGSAAMDGMLVIADAVASQAGPMMLLLGEVTRRPSFPEDEVALARANQLQSLKAAEAQPGFRAERAMATAVYGDHPYARRQQTEASINAVTAQMLRAEHARRFRPDRALLVVTGRISRDEAVRLAESAFGDWKASGAPVTPVAASRASTTAARLLLQRDGSVQSAVRLGRPGIAADHPDHVPVQLANAVLGGGFSSRLMQNLREEKGYTYGASSGLGMFRAGGRISASADVRNEVTGAAIKEFQSELSRMGSEPVPARELEDTKRYVAGGYLLANQMQTAVAATLASNWLVGLPPEFLGQYVPRIRAVTAEQVQAMGRKYFDPRDYSIVVVGDEKSVTGQLKPYGEFKASP